MKIEKITINIFDNDEESAGFMVRFDPPLNDIPEDEIELQPCVILLNKIMDALSDGSMYEGQPTLN